jgi:hypothetical protein
MRPASLKEAQTAQAALDAEVKTREENSSSRMTAPVNWPSRRRPPPIRRDRARANASARRRMRGEGEGRRARHEKLAKRFASAVVRRSGSKGGRSIYPAIAQSACGGRRRDRSDD